MRPIEHQRTNSRSHQRAAYRYLPYGRTPGRALSGAMRSAAQRAAEMIINPHPRLSAGLKSSRSSL
jgi:hypothetical protein